MEFIEGPTLRQSLDARTLTANQGRETLMQTIGAVSAAHAIGIAHCDLKPENILLRTGQPGNFPGRGRRFWHCAVGRNQRLSQADAASRKYMAPEQAKGEGSIRSDVFSLGLLAKDLLGANPGGNIRRIIERACSERPEDRFPDAGALGAALDEASKVTRRRALGIAGMAIVAAGASWWVWQKRSFSAAHLPRTGSITPGNMLFPDYGSGRILEFDPRRRAFVQAIPLPPEHKFEKQIASPMIRHSDRVFTDQCLPYTTGPSCVFASMAP